MTSPEEIENFFPGANPPSFPPEFDFAGHSWVFTVSSRNTWLSRQFSVTYGFLAVQGSAQASLFFSARYAVASAVSEPDADFAWVGQRSDMTTLIFVDN